MHISCVSAQEVLYLCRVRMRQEVEDVVNAQPPLGLLAGYNLVKEVMTPTRNASPCIQTCIGKPSLEPFRCSSSEPSFGRQLRRKDMAVILQNTPLQPHM